MGAKKERHHFEAQRVRGQKRSEIKREGPYQFFVGVEGCGGAGHSNGVMAGKEFTLLTELGQSFFFKKLCYAEGSLYLLGSFLSRHASL